MNDEYQAQLEQIEQKRAEWISVKREMFALSTKRKELRVKERALWREFIVAAGVDPVTGT